MVTENNKAKKLAKTYRNYFQRKSLTPKQLERAEKVRQEYIKETNYKSND